jgi:hypothetical protein
LAVINIAPWIFAILYDLFLYAGRLVWHEIPIWGGRARGQRRPRAPSLRERHRRSLSLADIVTGGTGGTGSDTREEQDGTRKRSHRKTLSETDGQEEEDEDRDNDHEDT